MIENNHEKMIAEMVAMRKEAHKEMNLVWKKVNGTALSIEKLKSSLHTIIGLIMLAMGSELLVYILARVQN